MVVTKNIDYTPDLTSDLYWDAHHIALVRIVAVAEQAGRLQVTTRVEEQFSEGRMEPARTAPIHHYWFGMHVLQPPPLSVDDRLVVIDRKEGPAPTVAYKLPEPAQQSPLVRVLRQIRTLRAGTGEAQELVDAALGSDETVSVYALERALAQPQSRKQPALAGTLRAARGDGARAPLVRVLASKLANKLEGKPLESDAEYKWVSAALTQAKEQDWTRLQPFIERLLEFAPRRTQTAKLLAGTATGAGNPQALRIAAYAAFDDPRLFSFAQPDASSEQLFAASVEMLKDRDELIRRAGVALLHNLSVRISPPSSGNYVDRARKEIQARARVERNAGVKSHCQVYLGRLERLPRG
ncbi:MAG TPA: hypothetical protein VF173_21950 [Thermoanaerobaculia bacterium]|nr:hypothetical protein [Thermoanaerobaculia bacterium]